MKYLISGGGTGGHIFPAISIANALRKAQPGCEILFVGAQGRMEMERVPAAGYDIKGLRVEGFDRKRIWRNIPVLFHLLRSMYKAKRIIADFDPDVAIGVGGYASGAALKAAAGLDVPILLQEQNSFAGVTNKMLARYASRICVAYDGMQRFFPEDKIVLTGNPVRQNLFISSDKREEALAHFGLDKDKPVLLFVGGSLGARTINQSVIGGLDRLSASGIQVLWQTGKYYYQDALRSLEKRHCANVHAMDFISRMDFAYLVSDLVVSRAGASSISELCILGKPSILVPSPNVAEDHQTYNALALSRKKAAMLVRDYEAEEMLIDMAINTVNDKETLAQLSGNAYKMAQHDSADRIAAEVIAIAGRKA